MLTIIIDSYVIDFDNYEVTIYSDSKRFKKHSICQYTIDKERSVSSFLNEIRNIIKTDRETVNSKLNK